CESNCLYSNDLDQDEEERSSLSAGRNSLNEASNGHFEASIWENQAWNRGLEASCYRFGFSNGPSEPCFCKYEAVFRSLETRIKLQNLEVQSDFPACCLNCRSALALPRRTSFSRATFLMYARMYALLHRRHRANRRPRPVAYRVLPGVR